MHIFIGHAQNCHISTSSLTSTSRSLTQFSYKTRELWNSQSFETDIGLFMFVWIITTKIEVLGAK